MKGSERERIQDLCSREATGENAVRRGKFYG